MSDETKVYISLESRVGHLTVDGPMRLWCELLSSLGALPDDPAPEPDRARAFVRERAEAVE